MCLSATVFTLSEPIAVKQRLLVEVLLFRVLVGREPFYPKARKFVTINQSPWAARSEDFAILDCTVLIWLKGVTDGQTDRRMDASTIAKTRYSIRKNSSSITAQKH